MSEFETKVECFPGNPGCEYSEENVNADPWGPTHTICLAHHDQIEAAKAGQAEREQAMRPHLDESIWGPSAPNPANYDESPF